MTDGLQITPFQSSDVAELLVLQRCCWVQEAIANDTLEIPPLTETHDDILAWTAEWATFVMRLDGRLIGAARGRREPGNTWHIGRVMVAPDLEGRGLGTELISLMESLAPEDTREFLMFTGAGSARNIRTYERAGYTVSDPEPAPHGGVATVTLRKPAA
ncbi:GNAT family N-acetyltransferase [Tsukamurella sp. PLM1]|uniref:GNAT family N-acetyltransferase n=1 Tax=Tsukamurella sp. PLM1 TaxID=2929795 RepID=UPI00207073D0|nr:GNAT family N-acetyltransferase [Tsukamurella sp. PLM1]BDH59318.1 tRNA (guanine-N1)-methyltransferase [Tsukamurella sp. PLM1]